jgi:hypothetical protein
MKKLGLTPVYAYGEWMYPSFLYRSFREALKVVGVTIPLNPQPIASLSRFRKTVRLALHGTPLPLYTAFNIGVVGRK